MRGAAQPTRCVSWLGLWVVGGCLAGERHLEDEAALVCAERSVCFAGWAARVVALLEPAIEGRVVEAPFDDEHLFRVLV